MWFYLLTHHGERGIILTAADNYTKEDKDMIITLKDRKEMKYMGYSVKAYYIRPNGIGFPKYFSTSEEFSDFTNKANNNGVILRDWAEL